MSTLADQIRELQARLEKINEAPVAAFQQYQQAPAADTTASNPADPQPAQSAMNVASNNIPQASTDVAQATPDLPSNEIPTIEAPTFSQAYAQAAKQGLKKFKWCGIYQVKPKPRPPQPQPASSVQPRFYSQGPSDAELKDKYGRPLPKASQDLIRQGHNDSTSAGGAAG